MCIWRARVAWRWSSWLRGIGVLANQESVSGRVSDLHWSGDDRLRGCPWRCCVSLFCKARVSFSISHLSGPKLRIASVGTDLRWISGEVTSLPTCCDQKATTSASKLCWRVVCVAVEGFDEFLGVVTRSSSGLEHKWGPD